MQSCKKISIKLYEELCSRGSNCLHVYIIYWGWRGGGGGGGRGGGGTNFTMGKKSKKKKNNLTITSKPHAHPHTMKKTHAKFHNNRYKTVRGVALTRGACTNCLYIKGNK